MAKNLAIIGSTGSIGTQTLDVVRNCDGLQVKALAAFQNDELLARQIAEFQPEIAVMVEEKAAIRLRDRLGGNHQNTVILTGREGLIKAATLGYVDTVVTSLTGFAGLVPTLAAIKAKKNVALANKETLVVAGDYVMRAAKEHDVNILPIDSEHCALWQCLNGEQHDKAARLLITASGGPFRGKSREFLQNVTVADCLKHPTWAMGKKITIDSATLVNKGLEVIEAHWLYNMPFDKITVVVHPQSIIHSMIEFIDGAVMAQLGTADMRLPIQYALTYPTREKASWPKLDFWQMRDLTFEKPDTDTFKGLPLAYEVGKAGGFYPCIFNAANELAVGEFLDGHIGFLDIYETIEYCIEKHDEIVDKAVNGIIHCDFDVNSIAYGDDVARLAAADNLTRQTALEQLRKRGSI